MTKREELALLHERHAELTEALARMGKSKRGTRWETDRIWERENIARQIDRLEDIPPVPSYNPADDPLYEGLGDDLVEPEYRGPAVRPEPAPPAARRIRVRSFEPSPDDQRWYAEASARGAFRPTS